MRSGDIPVDQVLLFLPLCELNLKQALPAHIDRYYLFFKLIFSWLTNYSRICEYAVLFQIRFCRSSNFSFLFTTQDTALFRITQSLLSRQKLYLLKHSI